VVTDPAAARSIPDIQQSVNHRLSFLYGPQASAQLTARVLAMVDRHRPALAKHQAARTGLDQRDALLITYGDSITEPGRTPLAALQAFLRERLGDHVTFVHLLPFSPWTSDDGFSVVDFRAVNPPLGSWNDIQDLAQSHRLVFDAVLNHVSSQSEYVQGFLRGDPAYKDFCIALPEHTDTRSVLRTRNLPLLHDYPSHEGTKWLWTTFSRDQVDLNYGNPAVLLEMLDVLLGYAARGASMIRLDAVPYLWKQLGTSCAHLPQTHEIIRLIRDVYDLAAPWVMLLTETNNPHHENVSYFGRPGHEGEEAQVIYNFTLAPLILHALFRGDCTALATWARGVRRLNGVATYLNVTATHDGIGMRPTEGILPESERAALVKLAHDRGGDMTGKRNSDGSVSPYEINITYFDALNGPGDDDPRDLQIQRFLLSQTIAMSFIGVPGIYIHSLLGSRNDGEGVKRTGRARSINRAQLDRASLERELADAAGLRAGVLREYLHRLNVRSRQPALSPWAHQQVRDLGPSIFALQRTCDTQTLHALHNVSALPQVVRLSSLGIAADAAVTDALTGKAVRAGTLTLSPYQAAWLDVR
jgi:sucrose phosphorylase